MHKQKRQKAFTLVELIVAIAIIGILVLLATPKFIAYTEEVQQGRILNDTKVLENKILEYLMIRLTIVMKKVIQVF